jgi:hypothetical protein
MSNASKAPAATGPADTVGDDDEVVDSVLACSFNLARCAALSEVDGDSIKRVSVGGRWPASAERVKTGTMTGISGRGRRSIRCDVPQSIHFFSSSTVGHRV